MMLFSELASFELLLKCLLVARRDSKQMLSDVTTEIDKLDNAKLSSAQENGAVTSEVRSFVHVLEENHDMLFQALMRVQDFITIFTHVSASNEPYGDNTDLAALLLEGKTKAHEAFSKVQEMTTRAFNRFEEILGDVNRELTPEAKLSMALWRVAIIRARTGLAASRADASAWLREVHTSLTEAVSDLLLRLTNIRDQLVAMNSTAAAPLRPPLSTFLNHFIRPWPAAQL